MCRVDHPELKNLVLHFRVPLREREKLVGLGEERSGYDGSRRNFYVLKFDRESTVRGWIDPASPSPLSSRRRSRRPPRHVLSFIVFPCSGSVIATGIRSSVDTLSAIALFSSLIDVDAAAPAAWPRKVVNSTYVGKVFCRDGRSAISTHRSLARFKRDQSRCRRRKDKSDVSISFRPQFFPGGLIRWSDAPGSVNLFNNGKYVVVGVRKEGEARLLCRRLSALIRTNWTTTTSRTSCAWTAD